MIELTYNGPGEYGVLGAGVFLAGETHAVAPAVAARYADNPEFTVHAHPSELALRNAAGKVDRIGYTGPVDSRFGYGSAGILILRALARAGIETRVNPTYGGAFDTIYYGDLPADAAAQCERRDWLPQVDLVHCLPDDLYKSKAPRKVAYTMWETSKIPDGSWAAFGDWAALINQHCERLIVPCAHNAVVFASGGVKVPITAIPYGVDTDVWPLIERPKRDTFTVVQYGDLTTRKGPVEAVQAFQLAFPTEQNVRLILKTQAGNQLPHYAQHAPEFRDPRVTVICESWSRAELLRFLADADCGIFLSRGEGFSLCPVQMALTGLPVVLTTHTGQAEYYKPQFFYGVRSNGLSTSPLGGCWYEPDITSAAEQLRKVYDNRKAATQRGKAAATHLRNNFSLDAFAKRLGAFVDTL